MFSTKYFVLTLLALGLAFGAESQVHGVVKDAESGDVIPGANIHWASTTVGTITDLDGHFSIQPVGDFPLNLVVSYVGYTSDTLDIRQEGHVNVSLSPSVLMDAVEISHRRGASNLSTMSKLNAESINRGILRKAACCNLSESFETTASVDVIMNDAVTGTRKIRMLGMDGVYVQNLFEGIPVMGGLGGIMGFDQIPGPWIESLAITKGIGSGMYGYESMTGVINMEFIKPDHAFSYFDVFGNDMGRFEANVIQTANLSDRLSTGLFVSANHYDNPKDKNGDGFVDSPLRQGVKVMNRWKYVGDNFQSQIMGLYTREDRSSGQMDAVNLRHRPEFPNYGFGFGVEQWEVLAKTGIFFPNREDQSIGITALGSGVDPDGFFGEKSYNGRQRTFRLNSIFSTHLSKFGDHKLDVGGHFVYDGYQEEFADSSFGRIERVPGISAEYTYDRPRFTFIGGLRHDWHNLHGNQFSPRVHLKYNLRPLTTLRAAGGRGYRSANVFADRFGMFASSRRLMIAGEPGIESSWNTGLSFLHKFELFGREAVFNTEYFFTAFEDRLIADRDDDPRYLKFYNLEGQSTSHSVQADIQAEPVSGLGVKFSYKYQQSETDYLSGRKEEPLVPRHRALGNVGYTSPNGDWYIDFTANYYGTTRLPSTAANPEGLRRGERSEDYFVLNSQITRTFGNFDLYVGVENLGNFIQRDAIVDAENPFGDYFDATMIYGPLEGRTFYFGVRYTNHK